MENFKYKYFENNLNPACGSGRLPCKTINNAILKKEGSMPQKFQTADSTSNFSLARKSYINVPLCSTFIKPNKYNCDIPVVRVETRLGNNCQNVLEIDNNNRWSQKKINLPGRRNIKVDEQINNYNKNCCFEGKLTKIYDNSEFIQRKKDLAIGKSSSINSSNNATSYQGLAPDMTTNKKKLILTSDADRALRRNRGNGYVVPKKVTQKPIVCGIKSIYSSQNLSLD